MRKIVVGLVVAFVAYYAVGAIGMTGPFAILTGIIGFMLGFGMVQTFWQK